MIRHLTTATLILAGLLCPPAVAADFISYPTSTAQQLPVAEGKAAPFDWNGFYAGVMGTAQSGNAGSGLGLGFDIGVSTTVNFVLAGAEVAVTGLGSGAAPYVQGVGRAGVLITDTALLYGVAGVGAGADGSSSADLLVGGGVELGLASDVSVRAQYLRGTPINGSGGNNQLTLGAQFHF